MDPYGFIILRHVNSENTNQYWNRCIMCVRRFYPNIKIVVIDDNSNKEFLKPFANYTNVEIVESEFPGRGELLPYYYFLKTKYFNNAVIIHDSVFFHSRINFENIIGIKVIPFWYFKPDIADLNKTIRISSRLRNHESINDKLSLKTTVLGLKHYKWYGCFGCQSLINHDFLTYIQAKYAITNMISEVKCRLDRYCLERILGAIFYTENDEILTKKSLLGDIILYPQRFSYTYDKYINDNKHNKLLHPIVKVWTGR
jgi:hypothetical protein